MCDNLDDQENPLNKIKAVFNDQVGRKRVLSIQATSSPAYHDVILQMEDMHQVKMDKAAVEKRLQNLHAGLSSQMEEVAAREHGKTQEQLSTVNTNVDGLQGKVDILERDVAQTKEKLAHDPIPALIEEQKKREKDIYNYIEGQMSRFGLQQEDITRLTSVLDEKPSEKQVRAMMASLHDKLQSKYGNSDAIAMMVENMKLEMRKKTSRDDCLRLVGIR